MTDKKTKVRTDPNIDPKDLWLEDTVDDKQLIEQLRAEFDNLVKKYNELQTKLEGAETDNAYRQEQITELQKAVKVLNDALETKPKKRLWFKFDTSNVELTRPLFNIMLRNKDRPKEFYIEVMDGDVVEVSETKL